MGKSSASQENRLQIEILSSLSRKSLAKVLVFVNFLSCAILEVFMFFMFPCFPLISHDLLVGGSSQIFLIALLLDFYNK